ncbi:hypothetical protein [Amycolatopsis jiangsuensis]|uniref:Uncharacterized protein n=1 Tax=Amycolatopsis jiangsuensis TaxID=1181879 RepID=A0A840IZB3_9PSEU|nr:hypothetical protein [Amycolatopsis jiangsuensis]MBB4686755.1 hypothetical protein [Amycolatopsis jiangsuensis]
MKYRAPSFDETLACVTRRAAHRCAVPLAGVATFRLSTKSPGRACPRLLAGVSITALQANRHISGEPPRLAEGTMVKMNKAFGVAAAAAALSAMTAAPANAGVMTVQDFAVFGGEVQMVVFGSGYHVDSVAISSQAGNFQGPAQFSFTYFATTSPTKSSTLICGGGSTGDGCYKKFSINATYSHGAGIRSCGSIKRVENNQNMGTACKDW